MTALARLLGLRAATPARRTPAPAAATAPVGWTARGMPQTARWDAESAVNLGYLGELYSYRCARTIAVTLGSLPFRAGDNPDKAAAFNVRAPLAQLLGPPPGGPAPGISPRDLWIWSIIAYLVTGRFGWETVTAPGTSRVASLWPLVAGRLKPIPTDGGTAWFSGFEYWENAARKDLRADQVFYAWRPAQDDWRQPESVLQAAATPLSTAIALDRFAYAFMRNGMSANKLVVTPEWANNDVRRAFQDQWLSEMTGFENAGRVGFAEYDDTDPQAKADVQVLDLGTKPVDAQMLEQRQALKNDICVAYGVPMSMLGNATDRTYENSDAEYRNFWTGTILPLAMELADKVNLSLAPRLGSEVGWFDFSKVDALRPAQLFATASPTDLVKADIVDPDEVREDLGLAPRDPKAAPIPEQLPAVDDTAGDTSKTNFSRRDAPSGPTVAGLAVKALDTGRVLMLQRAMSDDDPAAGRWEFPGGHAEPGEDLLAAAVREWMEETGAALPPGQVVDSWDSPNGVYRGFVFVTPSEDDVDINADERRVLNPDDPDGDRPEVAAWFAVADLPKMPSLRVEARTTPWSMLATAGNDRAARHDFSPIGLGKNWVTSVGGLPLFIRDIAHALIRDGHSEQQAIRLAVGVVRNWAAGKGRVSAKTRAKAAAALTEWERKKATANATPNRRDAVTEAGSAGLLLPKGAPADVVARRAHAFAYSPDDPRRCKECGLGVTARAHGLVKGHRHAGPGHHRTRTGHLSALANRTRRLADEHAETAEPQLAQAMGTLFDKQRKATMDRLLGKRGRQMLRAAAQPPDVTPPPEGQGTPPVNGAQIFDLAYWIEQTRQAVNPVLSAVLTMTTDRLAADLHPGEPVFPAAVDAAKQAMAARVSKLADVVTADTFDKISRAIADGVLNGEGAQGIAKRIRAVFDTSQTRAETIARTEVMGAISSATFAYADALPSGVVAHKQWLATLDARTRHDHAEANGQQRAMAATFTVGGFPMMFPHDPAAPASEVINCRCVLLVVPAKAAATLPAAA